MIDPDTGKLIIANGGTTLLNISDNQYGPATNLTATLQDTGDFQLKNEVDNRIIWKSMKLGSDLRTGRNWSLTSWLSNEIPDSGAFTMSWRKFSEINDSTAGAAIQDHYHGFNGVRPMWILTADGQVLDGESSGFLSLSQFCYGYDSGNGCVAGSNLPQCRSKDDNFSLRNGEFTPGTYDLTDVGNSSLSFSDCMVRCWNDCNCLAFNSRDNGTGCNLWTGTKSAIFSVNPQGTSIQKYVLLSPNPQEIEGLNKKKRDKKTTTDIFLSFNNSTDTDRGGRQGRDIGYMSPEYAMDGTFSVKSDVFSFGVLTLEIVSGRRNTSFSHLDKTVNLIGYAWELWQQGDALQLQDPAVADSCVVHQLLRTIHVALLCVQENAVDRPEMSEVISMLNNDTMLLPVPKRPAFFFGNIASMSTLVEGKAEDDGTVNNITMTQMEAR
ncbi:hypothetical protein M8C21_011602 [Ambrosia artemisiifolia]|uniref:Apple domain-containing protein n=1 Tax=Ambrosia artemisiifolia TaxID=4212 RepID=A0AAD5CIQ5_AMBAR|nr:hypothetical protein M8C21_011602 [Ambrosia artemisiifolia]